MQYEGRDEIMNFEDLLMNNPVVGAIRSNNDLKKILKSSVNIVFVLYGNILNIKHICDELKEKEKIVFVHIDMIEGLKSDQKGVEFIKEAVCPYGIISTKGINIKHAAQLGMLTIQRIFIIDSLAFETGIKNIHDFTPNAVEVLPGIACKAIKTLCSKTRLPVIAGGLIKSKKDAVDALSAGAMAVSTSSTELWDFDELSL